MNLVNEFFSCKDKTFFFHCQIIKAISSVKYKKASRHFSGRLATKYYKLKSKDI